MNVVRKILLLLSHEERKTVLILLGMMIMGMLLEMLGVGLVIPVIAIMAKADGFLDFPGMQQLYEFAGRPPQSQMAVWALLGLVGVYLVKNLFLAYLAWRQMSFVFGLQARLSQSLFLTYLCQPYTFHLQRNTAQLINNVIHEVDLFNANALLPSMLILTEGFVLTGIGCLLLVVEPLGTVMVLMILGGASWLFNYVTRARISQWGEARQRHDYIRAKHLHQGLGGIKEVKLLGRESEFFGLFRQHNQQSARIRQFQATLQQLPRMWLELLAVVGLALVVLSMLGQGREMASVVPTLGLFAAAAFRLMPSVNRVLGAAQCLRYGLPLVNTLHDEILPGTEYPRTSDESKDIPHRADISLIKVCYTYPGASAPALNDISLTVKKGESIGLIGASGSGKSTLVDMMLGILTPDTGQVMVNGEDIQQNIRGWQNQIGYVPQSTYLTDDTLKNNVAFGLPPDRIDEDSVNRAIRAAQLEEYVNSLPDGLETIVGERGVRLSGGQRQRIGIARALYNNPDVLVLDEATSALDGATEEGVMHAVTALQGSKTIIIIAHNLSTVRHCDRLYRLEHGKVVAVGAPAELIGKLAGNNGQTPC